MPCAQQSENREDYYDVRSDTSDPLERSNESALENVHILRENLENLSLLAGFSLILIPFPHDDY